MSAAGPPSGPDGGLSPERIAAAEAELRAREGAAEASPQAVERLLRFRVGSVWLAVAADEVEEISSLGRVSPLPGAPPHVVGLMILRSRVLPLMALHRFLAITAEEDDGLHEALDRVVVASVGGMVVGLMCDRISGVCVLPSDALWPPTSVQGDALVRYARAEVDEARGLLIVLDLARLLDDARPE